MATSALPSILHVNPSSAHTLNEGCISSPPTGNQDAIRLPITLHFDKVWYRPGDQSERLIVFSTVSAGETRLRFDTPLALPQ